MPGLHGHERDTYFVEYGHRNDDQVIDKHLQFLLEFGVAQRIFAEHQIVPALVQFDAQANYQEYPAPFNVAVQQVMAGRF